MKIVPFKKEHAFDILDRNVKESDAWISGNGNFETFVESWKDGGPAYSLIIDNKIVMCAGVFLLGWNRGEAWVLASNDFKAYKKTCFKSIMYKLEEIVFIEKLKRVQATVDPEYTEGIRFLEHLGFEREGLLKSFGPRNEDLLIFGKVCQ